MNTMKKLRRKTRTATTPRLCFLRYLPVFLLFCATVISSHSIAHAREHPKDYALIFGTVWGPDDRPVPGVNVKIKRVGDKKARWDTYSNRRGEFEQRLPVGRQDYVIWPDLKHSKLLKNKHLQSGNPVTVHIENNERADTGLHLK